MMSPDSCAMKIGAFELRPERCELLLAGEAHHLEPKVCDVLCRLAQSAGETVSRQALLDDVWGRTYGADESLTRAISILRKIFKADEERRYIQTIPKRGYVLTAPVRALTALDAEREPSESLYRGQPAANTVLPTTTPPPPVSSPQPRASPAEPETGLQPGGGGARPVVVGAVGVAALAVLAVLILG